MIDTRKLSMENRFLLSSGSRGALRQPVGTGKRRLGLAERSSTSVDTPSALGMNAGSAERSDAFSVWTSIVAKGRTYS